MPLSSLHFGKLAGHLSREEWERLVSMPLSSLHFGKLAAVLMLLWQPVSFPCR